MFCRRAVWTLMLCAVAASGAAAIEFHDYFIGFSTEAAVTAGPLTSPQIPDLLEFQHVSLIATYGPAETSPMRLRGGLGWFPGRPFRLTAGLEFPLYERLNRSRARMFGVYLLTDLALTVPLGLEADAVLTLLVPTSGVGGLRLGAGVNRHMELLFNIGFASGVYPIRVRR